MRRLATLSMPQKVPYNNSCSGTHLQEIVIPQTGTLQPNHLVVRTNERIKSRGKPMHRAAWLSSCIWTPAPLRIGTCYPVSGSFWP